MSLNNMVGWIAGATSVMVAGTAFASTTPADNDARIASLEAQLQALKAEQQSNWLNMNSEELLALQQEVLVDSQTQTSLLSTGVGAGWDKGFYLSSDDGAFKLKIGGQAQFRFVWNNRDDAPDQDGDVAGFEMRRTKLIFSGTMWEELAFKVNGAFDRGGGEFILEDAYGHWDLGNGWGVLFGQFKAPVTREELISSSKQQAVDRSWVNEYTNGDRTQGLALTYENDTETMRAWLSFNDGARTANTGFSPDATEWAFTARVEGLLAGENGFKQFDDLPSFRDDEFGWLLGGALHWQDEAYGTTDDETETLTWTVDTQAEFGGANIFAYVVGVSGESNDGTVDFDEYGFVLQGGFFFTDDLEAFGRWEWYDFDANTGLDEYSAITVGVNWYNHGHAWKWQNDVTFSMDPVPARNTGIGLLADTGNNDGQIAFRSQMQFTF